MPENLWPAFSGKGVTTAMEAQFLSFLAAGGVRRVRAAVRPDDTGPDVGSQALSGHGRLGRARGSLTG